MKRTETQITPPVTKLKPPPTKIRGHKPKTNDHIPKPQIIDDATTPSYSLPYNSRGTTEIGVSAASL